MTLHELKVVPPYFAEIAEGHKTFEIRKNDRGFQRGDMVQLREWHPDRGITVQPCPYCGSHDGHGHYRGQSLVMRVSFVYSGDPRFGGIEPGYVVLALQDPVAS